VLHWLTAVLIVVNLLLGFFQDSLFRGTVPLHKSIGLTVLVLGVARLLWRVAHPAPPLVPGMAVWERVLARANHVAFYLLIILLPLSGWACSPCRRSCGRTRRSAMRCSSATRSSPGSPWRCSSCMSRAHSNTVSWTAIARWTACCRGPDRAKSFFLHCA
jgi:cytochrome b561